MNVKLTAAQKTQIANSEHVYHILQAVLLRENALRRAQEHFWVMGFNNANKLLFMELVSLGGANRVSVKAPEVFRMAIYKTAIKVILAHNHPSGNLNYSDADLDLTDRLLKAGEIIAIDVIDHLIVSETGYRSMADDGHIDKMKKSDNYRVVSVRANERESVRRELLKVKSEYEGKMQVAAKLKAEGMDEAFIKKVTGVRLPDIRKL